MPCVPKSAHDYYGPQNNQILKVENAKSVHGTQTDKIFSMHKSILKQADNGNKQDPA